MKKKILVIISALLISLTIIFAKISFSQLIPGQNFGVPGLLKLKEVEDLYIGSSMFKQALDPEIIGDNDYILAYNGNEPTNIQLELEYALNQGLVIKNLYLDMYPWTAIRGPWIDDLKILWDTDLTTVLKTAKQLTIYAPVSYFYEFFVSSNNDYLLSYPISSRMLNRYYLKGGNHYISNPASKETLENTDLNSLVYDTDELDMYQIEAIERIASVCKEHCINLTFIETPKYYREMEWYRYNDLMNQYKDLLNRLDVKYILANELEFDFTNSEYFTDILHMSSKGAKIYTEKLESYK